MRLLPIVVLLLATSPRLFASGSAKGFYGIDAGVYCTNAHQRLTLSSSLATEASSLLGYLRLKSGISLGKEFFIEPSLLFTLPWRKGADGSAKVFYGHFALDLAVPLFSFLAVRLGPGIHSTFLLSSDEDVSLQNGSSSSFSTFHVPGAALFTMSFAFQAALQIKFSRSISMHLDVYAMNPLNSSRRNFDAAAGLGILL